MAERIDFSRRAQLDEHMDAPCSYEQLRDCLCDIAQVNRMTLAYRPTIEFLERVANAPASLDRPLRIVDVGCGYGDMLRRIEVWADARGLAVALTGVDLNPSAVRAAREADAARANRPGRSRASRIEWITGDAYLTAAAADADVVISSLLTHHLAEAEIVRFLTWMEHTARRGWFINDLHRQATPYHVFRVVAALAGWHEFVRHDGPVSIRRSFVREDWARMCSAAGLGADTVEIREARPARLCVARVKLA